MITIDDFAKVELKVGTVLEAGEVEGSDKLIKQIVDFGDEKRQVLSGIKQWYKPKDLVGKQFIYVTNLEPKQMMGLESQAMILATDSTKPIPISGASQVSLQPQLIKPSKKVASGTKLR